MEKIKISEKLQELGFELKEYYGGVAYVFRASREDRNRFVHDFAYYASENQFYINAHKSSGARTISEDEILRDHNDLNTPAKEKWLEIKNELKDFDFKVWNGFDDY